MGVYETYLDNSTPAVSVQTFPRPLDTESELTLTLGALKCRRHVRGQGEGHVTSGLLGPYGSQWIH